MVLRLALAVVLLGALAGACQSTPTPTPGPRVIADIESGLTLVRMIESVGVPVGDPEPVNRAARTRVRAVRCLSVGPARATCVYEADQCLADEADPDGDGWCARTRTFAHGQWPLSLMDPAFTSHGWTPERPLR